MSIDVPIALAVGAGMLATVNPCGFALLPAYVGFFVGQGDDASERRNPLARALVVSAVVTAGFVVVFAGIGLAVTSVAQSLDDHLSWVTIVVGIAFVLIGARMLLGRELVLSLPKLERGGRTRSLPSMFVFGISYAVASLSCTLPVFLTTLTPTFRRDGVASGVLAFVSYAIGMGLVLAAVTVALAVARTTLVRRLRAALPYVSRVSGALLVVAGAYIAYYGWWEQRGDFDADPVIDTALDLQSWLATRVDSLPRVVLVSIVAVAFAGAVVLGRRRHAAAKAREEVLPQ